MGRSLMSAEPDGSQRSAWYHCGVCGEVFPGALGAHAPLACAACGAQLRRASAGTSHAADPASSLLRTGVQRDMQKIARRMSLDPNRSSVRPVPRATAAPRSRRGIRRPRSRKGTILGVVLTIWVLGLIGLGVMLSQRPGIPRGADGSSNVPASARIRQDEVTLRAAMPRCQAAWFDFLRSGTPEARAQSVKDGYLVVGEMQRFYQNNPALNLTTVPVQHFGGLISTPQGLAIETRWAAAEQQFEVVFFNQKGEWRMDWKHHVRHAEMDWALFLAGLGEDVGDFRLYVRERQAGGRSDGMISVVFYLPRYDRVGEYGPQSPEFLVPADSEAGRNLSLVLARAQQHIGAYQSKLAELDPAGLARVRVKILRLEAAGKRKFQLEKVLAGHWLDIADPGIDEVVDGAPGAEVDP